MRRHVQPEHEEHRVRYPEKRVRAPPEQDEAVRQQHDRGHPAVSGLAQGDPDAVPAGQPARQTVIRGLPGAR